MTTDPLTLRARALWMGLAGAPVLFGGGGAVSVVVSPESRMCPPGWLGIARVGDAAIASAPDSVQAEAAAAAFARLSLDEILDPARLGAVLPLARILGPAALAYVCAEEFQRAEAADAAYTGVADAGVEQITAPHADIDALEQAAGLQDADEVDLSTSTSPVFVIRSAEGNVISAAGYRVWPSETAHISVLTDPAWRDRGLARATGSAATRHALDAGLLPQWRARVPASRRVAAALGFRELGLQLSVRLASDGPSAAGDDD